MSEAVRLAMIGCGGMAGAHREGYQKLWEEGLRDCQRPSETEVAISRVKKGHVPILAPRFPNSAAIIFNCPFPGRLSRCCHGGVGLKNLTYSQTMANGPVPLGVALRILDALEEKVDPSPADIATFQSFAGPTPQGATLAEFVCGAIDKGIRRWAEARRAEAEQIYGAAGQGA